MWEVIRIIDTVLGEGTFGITYPSKTHVKVPDALSEIISTAVAILR